MGSMEVLPPVMAVMQNTEGELSTYKSFKDFNFQKGQLDNGNLAVSAEDGSSSSDHFGSSEDEESEIESEYSSNLESGNDDDILVDFNHDKKEDDMNAELDLDIHDKDMSNMEEVTEIIDSCVSLDDINKNDTVSPSTSIVGTATTATTSMEEVKEALSITTTSEKEIDEEQQHQQPLSSEKQEQHQSSPVEPVEPTITKTHSFLNEEHQLSPLSTPKHVATTPRPKSTPILATPQAHLSSSPLTIITSPTTPRPTSTHINSSRKKRKTPNSKRNSTPRTFSPMRLSSFTLNDSDKVQKEKYWEKQL
eukprot:TRINITY_DN4953_c0_g1_i1.p1 TRINITY_DN4953_c0_g1~~TRINITY_DN4953_c0_g1_i1.p1  ORF type:complete len:307 (+),score=102.57 TRINITY_DN4953_c0_g1_i1:1-921(+)